MLPLNTNLQAIKQIAADNEAENDLFKIFLKQQPTDQIDGIVHQLNNTITAQIDCTQCGNCCKSLMINVTPTEAEKVANALQLSITNFKQKYIEESQAGALVINSVPCSFLHHNKCTIYQNRFNECTEFPHLHKPNFINRLFGTMYNYAICPIVFNVVEALKSKLQYTTTVP